MNMISQKYENLLKNRIQDKISSLSDEFINYLINNLFNTNEIMYLDFINKTQEFSFEIIKQVIIEVFKELDDNFKNSLSRLKEYNINKSNVKRTIVTIVGEITFYRTYFESKDKTKKFFYIDEIFHLPKYDHYDPIVKAFAIDMSFDTNQLKAGNYVGQNITTIKNYSSEIRNKLDINKIKMFAQSTDSLQFYNLWNFKSAKYIRRLHCVFHNSCTQEYFLNVLRYMKE